MVIISKIDQNFIDEIREMSDEELNEEEQHSKQEIDNLRKSISDINIKINTFRHSADLIANEKKDRAQRNGQSVTEMTGMYIHGVVLHDRNGFGFRREDFEKWLLSRPGVLKVNLFDAQLEPWDGDDPFPEDE